MKTGEVTYAVRDTHIDDKEIHEGDFMGIGDHSILSVGKEPLRCDEKDMLAAMADDDSGYLLQCGYERGTALLDNGSWAAVFTAAT